jgi:hypothetical protein
VAAWRSISLVVRSVVGTVKHPLPILRMKPS